MNILVAADSSTTISGSGVGIIILVAALFLLAAGKDDK